jgi:hypothetical protein
LVLLTVVKVRQPALAFPCQPAGNSVRQRQRKSRRKLGVTMGLEMDGDLHAEIAGWDADDMLALADLYLRWSNQIKRTVAAGQVLCASPRRESRASERQEDPGMN